MEYRGDLGQQATVMFGENLRPAPPRGRTWGLLGRGTGSEARGNPPMWPRLLQLHERHGSDLSTVTEEAMVWLGTSLPQQLIDAAKGDLACTKCLRWSKTILSRGTCG